MTQPDTSNHTLPMMRVGDGPRVANSTDPHAFVLIVYGGGIGHRLDIGEMPIMIGRGEDAAMRINHPSVSRRQCLIWRDGDDFRIRDLGATNPTQLNHGIIISEAVLHDGDHITLGECVLKFITGGNPEARYHEEIYRLAVQDPLTGLDNRRHFLDAMDREIARAIRYLRPLSLCLIDIDLFNSINDQYGHVEGDRLLRQVAGVLRNSSRADDVSGRIGGEEFALLLPETKPETAYELAERLRKLVEGSAFNVANTKLNVTISIGVCSMSDTLNTRSGLFAAANEALLRAKQQGRNQVCAHEAHTDQLGT